MLGSVEIHSEYEVGKYRRSSEEVPFWLKFGVEEEAELFFSPQLKLRVLTFGPLGAETISNNWPFGPVNDCFLLLRVKRAL